MKLKILIAVLGAVSFWGPTTVIELMTRQELSRLIGSLLPTVTTILCYFLLRRKYLPRVRTISFWMLIGVYTLGPLFMTIGATPRQGGFSQFHHWSDLKWLLVSMIFPPFTVLLAAYHVIIVGLLLTTFIFLIMHTTLEQKPVPTK